MKKAIFGGLLLLVALPGIAQKLSRERLEECYFHVEAKHLEHKTSYVLVEFRSNPETGRLNERSYPELDHWALLMEQNPDFRIEIEIHASTNLDAETANAQSKRLARDVEQYLKAWQLGHNRIQVWALSNKEPRISLVSIDSIPQAGWKAIAHELNAHAVVRVYRVGIP